MDHVPGEPQQAGKLGLEPEGALGTGPYRRPAVGVDAGDAGLGLYVPLVHRHGPVLPIDDDVTLLEGLVHVSPGHLHVHRYVGLRGADPASGLSGAEVRVDYRGIGAQGLGDGAHHPQVLVLHLDQVQGLLGYVGVGGSHGGHRVPRPQGLALGVID